MSWSAYVSRRCKVKEKGFSILCSIETANCRGMVIIGVSDMFILFVLWKPWPLQRRVHVGQCHQIALKPTHFVTEHGGNKFSILSV